MPEIPKGQGGPQALEADPEIKAARMPGHDDMIRKLEEAGIYGMTPEGDKMLDNFVESVADSERVGQGLMMAWEVAFHDTLRSHSPLVQAKISAYFDKVIDAVVSDPEVAAEAKRSMQEVREETRKRQVASLG